MTGFLTALAALADGATVANFVAKWWSPFVTWVRTRRTTQPAVPDDYWAGYVDDDDDDCDETWY